MRRDPENGRPWGRVVVGLLMAAGGLASAVLAAGAWLDRPAYARGDGVVTTTGVVLDKHGETTKGITSYTVVLRVDGRERDVDAPEAGDAYDALFRGETVGVRLWEGHVAAIDVPGGGRLETDTSPARESVEWTALALCLVPFGLAGVASGVRAGRAGGWWKSPDVALTGRAARVQRAVVAPGVVLFVLVSLLDVYEVVPLVLATVAAGLVAFSWERRRYSRT